jgi:hypothetical protein
MFVTILGWKTLHISQAVFRFLAAVDGFGWSSVTSDLNMVHPMIVVFVIMSFTMYQGTH